MSLLQIIFMVRDNWTVKKVSKMGVRLTNSFRNQYSPENLSYFRCSRDLLENIEQHSKTLKAIFNVHSQTSSVSVFYQLISMMVLAEGKEFNDAHFDDVKLILGSAKDTESAQIPKDLEEISKLILKSGLKGEFCKIEPSSGMDWLEKRIPNAGALFKEFIHKNQHRALKEVG